MDKMSSSADANEAGSGFPRRPLVPQGPTKRRFEVIFKSGLSAGSKNLRILANPGDGRIGIATARSIGGKPGRNHAKRRMREIVRASAGTWRLEMDYIVLMKAESNQVSYNSLKREASELLNVINKRWDDASESS
jgi:ribonuclease P protein component